MLKKKYFSKILGIIFLIFINYIFIFFSLYIFSAFLLINKITPDIKLIRDYQRNFYQFAGIREIWQSNLDCIDYDKELIFVPKKTSCDFKNIEFDTSLKFDDFGRFSNHPPNDNNGIVVLGDSHAMGWGLGKKVQSSSWLLEKFNNQENEYNKPRQYRSNQGRSPKQVKSNYQMLGWSLIGLVISFLLITLFS